MKGIITEGVRGAFIRLIRLIVYILIILTITFIVGLFTQKKASALVYKGTNNNITLQNSSWSVNFPQANEPVSYNYRFNNNWNSGNIQYNLLAFHLSELSYFIYENPNVSHQEIISGTITNNSIGNSNSISMTLNAGTDKELGVTMSFSGILWSSSGVTPCYLSAEYNNTFMCPIMPNENYQAFTILVNANVGYGNNATWNAYVTLSVDSYIAFYNYESTEIVNSNGTIVNNQTTIITQQQQQNDYVQNGSTTGAQTDSTNALSGLQQTFSQKMTGMNELTQMVFAPIQMMLTVSSGTCIPMEWDIPFVNTHVVIPCMSTIYNNYFGLFITMFSTVIMGIYAYRSVLKLVNCIKDILDAENDKLEVLEL